MNQTERATEPAAPRRHLRLLPPPETDPAESVPSAHDGGAGPVGRSRTDRRAAAAGERLVQGALPLLFTLPTGAPARPATGRALRLVSYQPRVAPDRRPTSGAAPVALPLTFDRDDDAHLVPTPRAQLPEPRRWAAALVQAAVETRHGDRPVTQLVRWTSREVYERLVRDAGAGRAPLTFGRRRAVRPVIRSLHVSEPDDGVVEACAVVHDGTRGRAVALRIEGLDGRWVCTAFDLL